MGNCSKIQKNPKKYNSKSETDDKNKENELDEQNIFD